MYICTHHEFLSLGYDQAHVRSRNFAAETTPAKLSKNPVGAGITGLFQRISSFLVGAGLTALGTQYFIWDEVRKSNMFMIEKQIELEKRLLKLEKK
jgi:hypothetical protein